MFSHRKKTGVLVSENKTGLRGFEKQHDDTESIL